MEEEEKKEGRRRGRKRLSGYRDLLKAQTCEICACVYQQQLSLLEAVNWARQLI